MNSDTHRRTAAARRLLYALALGASGCAETDPLYMPGRWQPGGVNQANLAMEVQNPADLLQGRSDAGSDGQEAAAAVARLRLGVVKPLPDTGLADIRLGHVNEPQAAVVPGAGGY